MGGLLPRKRREIAPKAAGVGRRILGRHRPPNESFFYDEWLNSLREEAGEATR